jgi:hypothetical protein
MVCKLLLGYRNKNRSGERETERERERERKKERSGDLFEKKVRILPEGALSSSALCTIFLDLLISTSSLLMRVVTLESSSLCCVKRSSFFNTNAAEAIELATCCWNFIVAGRTYVVLKRSQKFQKSEILK